RIDNFLDDGEPSVDITKLDKPIAQIAIETDRRVLEDGPPGSGASGTVKTRTEVRELLLGCSSDEAHLHRYARLGKDGPAVIVSAKGLGIEHFEPATYVSRKAMDVVPADVGGIVLEATDAAAAPTPAQAPSNSAASIFPARVFRRSLDQWT